MATIEYVAKRENGEVFSGICDNSSVALLREDLAKMGDSLIKVKRQKKKRFKNARIPQDEIVTFTFKLAGMCSAGLSITGSLESLHDQTENQSFKIILADIKKNIAAGSTLKNAFGKYRNVFSDFFLGMIEAGETGGKLSQTLEASAEYLEKRADFRHKIKSAFAYPIIVGIMCFLVVTALVIFVVPVFSKIYKRMHVPLPGPTQVLIIISDVIHHWWWLILVCLAALIYGFILLKRKKSVKAKWDALKLNMPVIGKFNRMVVASQFTRTFAMLNSAGVSLVKAFEVASIVVSNAKVSEITAELQKSVSKGNTVAGSLKQFDIFPPVISQLAAAGEEAGKLSEMLNKGADFLDKDIDRMIKSMLVRIEPILTAVMGVIIGFILISMYLPMFDYMNHLQ
ncbi:MAG: type II secretion system F family protein [Sedimentisphaerales bacterium]|nr:type II secretion system F family protein [Sedimentisphaerales bacterium]